MASNSKMTTQSYHIFLFPFRWDFVSKKIKNDDIFSQHFTKRTDISEIIDTLNKNKLWKRNKLGFNSTQEFNASGYFYDFVNDAIFDEEDKFNKTPDISKTVISYKIDMDQNLPNTFSIFINGQAEPYELTVDDIQLNIYKTGVAILSFHLNNKKQTAYL